MRGFKILDLPRIDSCRGLSHLKLLFPIKLQAGKLVLLLLDVDFDRVSLANQALETSRFGPLRRNRTVVFFAHRYQRRIVITPELQQGRIVFPAQLGRTVVSALQGNRVFVGQGPNLRRLITGLFNHPIEDFFVFLALFHSEPHQQPSEQGTDKERKNRPPGVFHGNSPSLPWRENRPAGRIRT